MNKQIKELAHKADFIGKKNNGAEWRWGYIDPELAEKLETFAELIVQECLRQVEEQYKPVLEDKEMMKDTHWDGYVQCGVDSYVAIREHFFGVEL